MIIQGDPSLLKEYEQGNAIYVPLQYPTIQAGIDAASDGFTIFVENGTYQENILIDSKDIVLQSINNAENCIIDGGSNDSVIRIENSENTEITGFTIQNGTASYGGGGILINGSPLIHDCIIQNNSATRGGGIFITGSPVIRNNVIQNNTVTVAGAGMVSYGGSATIQNNIIIENVSDLYGGGIHIEDSGDVLITDNFIQNNSAVARGGGVCFYAEGFGGRFIDNLVVNNTSDLASAIFFSFGNYTLINNTIANNSINAQGLVFDDYSQAVLINNIIWGNVAEGDGEQLYIYDDYSYTSGYTISNNIIQGGFDSIYVYNSYAGIFTNNLDTSPAFLDSINHDYNLSCSSPAIEAGAFPITPMPLLDVDGSPRLMGSVYDIGAYEKNAFALVVSNPQSVVVMTGTSTSFNVIAIGASSYQWQLSDNLGVNWTNITDNAVYSGSTTATLNINADYTLNGNQYRCELGGNCPGAFSFSDYAFLVVDFNVGIDDNENMISVYPNPSKADFIVQNAQGATLIISDVNGRVVETYSDLSSNKETISLSNQARGIYFLKIIKEDNLEVIKIIKE
jgi:hypothetical protein